MVSVVRGAPHSTARIPAAAISRLASVTPHQEIVVAQVFGLLVT
jgi:hypothetical protein